MNTKNNETTINKALELLNSHTDDFLSYSITNSQIPRFSSIPLETMRLDHGDQRIAENHGIQYFLQHLKDQFAEDIVIKCNRKLKKSSVDLKIQKAKGDQKFDKLILTVSAIQVSYRSLVEAKKLAETLIKIYRDKGVEVKFPTGDWTKTMSRVYEELQREYGFTRYQGFDPAIACGSNIVCGSCGYAWTQINMGKPDSETFKCRCGSRKLIENRKNYNYRTDNVNKHWGTMETSKELLKHVPVQRWLMLSLIDKKTWCDVHKMSFESVSKITDKFQDNAFDVVESKEDENKYHELKYTDLQKLAKKAGYKGKSKTKDSYIEFLSSLEETNSNE